MKSVQAISILLSLVLLTGTQAMGNPTSTAPNIKSPLVETVSRAKRNLKMIMFHSPSSQVTEALLKAKRHGVNVQVILDSESINKTDLLTVSNQLRMGGVNTRIGSQAFSTLFTTALVIDSKVAFISSGIQEDGDFSNSTDDIYEFETEFDSNFIKGL